MDTIKPIEIKQMKWSILILLIALFLLSQKIMAKSNEEQSSKSTKKTNIKKLENNGYELPSLFQIN